MFTPATKPEVIERGKNAEYAVSGVVCPVLTPLIRMSTPLLSVVYWPEIVAVAGSSPARLKLIR